MTEIVECLYDNKKYTCVIQPIVKGSELKKLSSELLEKAVRENKEFLLELLRYFFENISVKELYPDIVGYPKNPEYANSINLILEQNTGKIILCDVGLSPHEDTLMKYGNIFFESDSVKTYVEKMREFENLLLRLG